MVKWVVSGAVKIKDQDELVVTAEILINSPSVNLYFILSLTLHLGWGFASVAHAVLVVTGLLVGAGVLPVVAVVLVPVGAALLPAGVPLAAGVVLAVAAVAAVGLVFSGVVLGAVTIVTGFGG